MNDSDSEVWLDKSVRISAISTKSLPFAGIQIYYTNGMKSPMFKTRFGLQSNSKSKKTTVSTANPIRKVSVKVASGFICGIRLQDQNGSDLLNLDWLGSADWET